MKLCKRIVPLLLVMMLLLSTPAFAAGSIDLNREVTLTISYQDIASDTIAFCGARYIH